MCDCHDRRCRSGCRCACHRFDRLFSRRTAEALTIVDGIHESMTRAAAQMAAEENSDG